MSLVSIIIPCFNGADHVSNAVESALAQTTRDIEILIVDDGSTDNTKVVLEPYLLDQRVQYLYQENRGLPGARNAGAVASKSEFLAFLDADDRLTPNAIEVMLQEVLRTGSAWCLIDILKIFPSGEEVQRTIIPSGSLVHGILKDDFIRRAMFFQRYAFFKAGMYDEKMKNREDWDLNIRMFAAGLPFTYIAQPLYFYNWRAGSITRNRKRILDYTEKLLDKHHKQLADQGSREVAMIYASLMWALGRERLYQTSDLRAALRCVAKSVRYDFSFPRFLHPVSYRIKCWMRTQLRPR